MLETMASQNPIQVTPPGEPRTGHIMDLTSLMLRRMNAVPVRLKILLDRLLITLDHDQIKAILHDCGWTYDDYVRGYKLQVDALFSLHKLNFSMNVLDVKKN